MSAVQINIYFLSLFVIGEEAYMAESQTFYLSFAPAMDILQHKGLVKYQIMRYLSIKNEGYKYSYIWTFSGHC